MRNWILLLLCACISAPVGAAEYEYIIPIVGFVRGADGGSHWGSAVALNTTRRTASVRVTGVYPVIVDSNCRIPDSWTLPPRTSRLLMHERSVPSVGCDSYLSALSVISDEPLHIMNEITTLHLGGGCRRLRDHVEFKVPEAWIQAGQEATASAVIEKDFLLRSNLLIVNPNDDQLTLRMHIVRPEANSEGDHHIVVGPRSTLLMPIEQLPPPPPTGFLYFIDGVHRLTLVGDDRFWAGVSVIDPCTFNDFNEAIPLEP